MKTTLIHNHNGENIIDEILALVKATINQNYFYYNNQYFKKEGLAMGAPTSALFSEFFLRCNQHTHVFNFLNPHNIKGYLRYVDDILITYNKSETDVNLLLKNFKNIHPKLTFTSELEIDNKLNFLDITIHKQNNSLQATIYRKPTTTDCIIPYNSNHPNEQKQAAIKYFVNRVNDYPIEKAKEINAIQHIAHNNSFPK
ncbi:hypothetical protein Cfor_01032 [Coptotermes formosanus]|uniref:Reverse transcriptase domain-containing protein n=1 Tax=Coptotermes formosanus TaxID=36987 RepID=A0A6L2PSZ4_COPFO|nr:hypothetical protein Cfor_01032 [Coptotermes formosanus]